MNNLNEKEYPKVRALTRKDRKKLTDLIKDFAEKSGNSRLTSMLPGVNKSKPEAETETADKPEDEQEQTYDLIKKVMLGLLEWVEEDVNKWFMELVGITDQNEYDNLPFDIEVHIIDSLIAQKGFNNFFLRVSAFYKKIRGSKG